MGKPGAQSIIRYEENDRFYLNLPYSIPATPCPVVNNFVIPENYPLYTDFTMRNCAKGSVGICILH